MQNRDYFDRLVQQLAAAVALITGHVQAGQLDEAERELEATWLSGLGMRRGDAMRLDDVSFGALLGWKAPAAATLLEAEATLHEARGRAGTATALRRRAAALGPRR